MLQHLSIRNFTIISALDLEFNRGMTVLTGETGAGKSILIDALLLTLGGRADSSIIQPGSERCTINASFNIQQLPAAQQWLQEHELASEQECLLRRIVNSDGRSRGFINDQAVTIQQLRELSNLLVSIHGQHEHQALLKPDKQRMLLDAYAGHHALCKQVSETYSRWREAQDQLAALQTQNQQRAARHELLSYQVQELNNLALEANECQQLDQEQRQLANTEQLLESYQTILNFLADNEEVNVLNLLNSAQTQLTHLQSLDNKLQNANELLNNTLIQAEELSNELRHYFDHLELNPERLQVVEQRLSAVHELARKHRVAPEELLDLQQRLAAELNQLENSDLLVQQLQQTISQLADAYQQVAKQLSQSRQQAAQRLAPLIETSIHELNMPGGRFKVEFIPNENAQFTSYGLERIEFHVSANPGQPVQPLAKVASGGELSRISLAIHVLTAQNDTTPTLIFDEVDVGIGGGTAEIVGRLLRTLASSTQVLCVTHLPQVAAQSHHHLQVGKTNTRDSTQTDVRVLDKNTKIQEIARMLGGVKITEQTLAHAREMVGAS